MMKKQKHIAILLLLLGASLSISACKETQEEPPAPSPEYVLVDKRVETDPGGARLTICTYQDNGAEVKTYTVELSSIGDRSLEQTLKAIVQQLAEEIGALEGQSFQSADASAAQGQAFVQQMGCYSEKGVQKGYSVIYGYRQPMDQVALYRQVSFSKGGDWPDGWELEDDKTAEWHSGSYQACHLIVLSWPELTGRGTVECVTAGDLMFGNRSYQAFTTYRQGK